MTDTTERGGFLDSIFEAIRTKFVAPTKTVGSGGTAVFSGFVDEKESDAKLQGSERYKTFSDILANLTIVAAGVRLYLNLIGKAQWKFEPADDSEEAAQIAEDVERILTKEMTTPWTRVVRRAGMYRFYGFSVQEWTAKRGDDGVIGFLDIEPRAQITIERWDLDATGTVFGVVQRSPQDMSERYIPRAKMLYIVDDALNDSPIGLGLFRHVVESARRLKRYSQLEGYGFETDLRGIPIGRAPLGELDALVKSGNLTEAQKASYLVGIRTFLSSHIKNPELGLLLESSTYETTDERRTPSSVPKWNLEILTGGATSHEAVAKAIERLTRDIAILMGVEGLLLGQGSSGSRALGETKSDTLAQIVDASLDDIVAAVQSDLVVRLVELNGWDSKLAPKAKTDALQHRDIKEITGALRDLAASSAALAPTDEAFGEVFDLLGLTRPDGEALMARLKEEALLGQGIGPDGEPLVPGTEPGGDAGSAPGGKGAPGVPATEDDPKAKGAKP